MIFASFWGPPLIQFLKFKKILWVCWFLGKNLSNFIYPVWKLHNPYCHSGDHTGTYFIHDEEFVLASVTKPVYKQNDEFETLVCWVRIVKKLWKIIKTEKMPGFTDFNCSLISICSKIYLENSGCYAVKFLLWADLLSQILVEKCACSHENAMHFTG